ncbi:MAG: OmpA family protein [Sphingobacteriaceae bacterium]|nr:MAG: hypothetical protein E6Q66_04845 [Pedobacter sp.]
MKYLFGLLSAIVVLSSLNACVVLSSKKYRTLVSQCDSIADGLNNAKVKIESLEGQIAQLRIDTIRLNQQIAALQGKADQLHANYTSLRSNSASKINQLSEDLKKREARLKEVEEVLRKRDEATNALKDKLQKALLGFQQSGLSVDIRNGKVYVSLTDKLLFDTGSIIIDEKGKLALQELAKVLKNQPEINISVEGHTDNQRVAHLGQIKDNWDLSVLRATSVVRYLTEIEKIENTRITATGKGEFQPIASGSTPDSRSRNRRIEIVLSPKLDELYNLIK